MSEERKLSDAEIVAGLRGTDDKQRAAALQALYPGDGVVLIQMTPQDSRLYWTERLDMTRTFHAALTLTEMVAKRLGLDYALVAQHGQSRQPRIEAVTELDKVGAALARRGRGFGT